MSRLPRPRCGMYVAVFSLILAVVATAYPSHAGIASQLFKGLNRLFGSSADDAAEAAVRSSRGGSQLLREGDFVLRDDELLVLPARILESGNVRARVHPPEMIAEAIWAEGYRKSAIRSLKEDIAVGRIRLIDENGRHVPFGLISPEEQVRIVAAFSDVAESLVPRRRPQSLDGIKEAAEALVPRDPRTTFDLEPLKCNITVQRKGESLTVKGTFNICKLAGAAATGASAIYYWYELMDQKEIQYPA